MARKAANKKAQKAKAAVPAVNAETTSVHPTAPTITNAATTPVEPAADTGSSPATTSTCPRPIPTGAAALQAASRAPLQPIDMNVNASADLLSVHPAPQANAGLTAAPPTTSSSATVPPVGSTAASTPPAPTTTDNTRFSSLKEEVRLLWAERDSLVQALASANAAPPPPPPPPVAPAAPASETDLIPRPRLLPGNHQVALGLSHDRGLYLQCRRIIRSCVNKVEEAYQVNWHDQPNEFIAKVKSLAKAKCPHLGCYRNGWATELLMCGSNKNKRRYDKVLERDPDGMQRKAQAAARNARRTSATSHSSNNDADDKCSTHEDNSNMQATAGPSNTNNGIDNTSELSEEDYAEMGMDSAGNENAGEDEDEDEEEEVQPQRKGRSQKLLIHNSTRRPIKHNKISPQRPVIECTKFEFSRDSALSILESFVRGWRHDINKSQRIGSHYRSLILNNLVDRITNTQLHLQILADDKQNATTPGKEDPLLLELVLRDEKSALAALQSFLDDLQSFLDDMYEKDPQNCSSLFPGENVTESTPPPSPLSAPSSPPVSSSLSPSTNKRKSARVTSHLKKIFTKP
ncbi:hypothetical protein BJ165DRAFT_1532139 [Panaeolus papilionaceus]|nr:hypothetical protein BJ165DRAFT_1532139 [Panaeolus papilionaceus]